MSLDLTSSRNGFSGESRCGKSFRFTPLSPRVARGGVDGSASSARTGTFLMRGDLRRRDWGGDRRPVLLRLSK